MSFQSPIPVPTQPIVGEISRLAPTRDRNATAKQWQTNNRSIIQTQGLTNVTRRLQYQLNLIRGRSLAPQVMHPFKVYNVPQSLCPPNGTYGGNAYDPAKDQWRTFRIRTGGVGFRQLFTAPNFVETGYNLLSGGIDTRIGMSQGASWEMVLRTYSGSDGNDFYQPRNSIVAQDLNVDNRGLSNTSGPSLGTLSSEVLFIPDDGSVINSTKNTLTTFVLPKTTINLGQGIEVSFWMEIVPDTVAGSDFAWTRMGARAYGPEVGRPFVDGQNIFALAVMFQPEYLSGGFPNQFAAYQYQYTNLTNRYNESWIYRGNWSEDSLSGQVMYPGDIITFTDSLTMQAETGGTPPQISYSYASTGGSDNITDLPFQRLFRYINDVPTIETANPPLGIDVKWMTMTPLS